MQNGILVTTLKELKVNLAISLSHMMKSLKRKIRLRINNQIRKQNLSRTWMKMIAVNHRIKAKPHLMI